MDRGDGLKAGGVPQAVADEVPRGGRQAALGLAVVGLGTLMAPLDSAVNIAFPHITAAFDRPLRDIQWVVICYVLTHASLLIACGRLGDLFGHRRVFAWGLGVGVVAFVLCGTAPSYGWLLAARALQGVGAALVMSVGPALATGLYPEHMRGRVLGIYTTMFALGMALGPLLGGVAIEAFGWGAVFWGRAPLALAALALLRFLPAPRLPAAGGRFDLLGAALLTIGLSTLLLGLNRLRGDADDLALAAALGGVATATLVWFTLRERRSTDPVIRLAPFRDLGFTLIAFANFAVNLVGFAVMLLVPFWLGHFLVGSIGFGGAVLAASPIGIMAGAAAGGWAIGRVPANRVAFAGGACVVAGMLAIANWGEAPSLAAITTSLALNGFGVGLFQVCCTDIVAARLPLAERGVAGSLAMLTRTIGILCGASLLTMLFDGVEAAALADGLSATDAFRAAFGATFVWSGGLLLVFFAATLLRPRVWFGPPTERTSEG